jgi:outer membrane biosynthesis protein TonB
MDAVSEILDDRARQTDKVTRMVVVSLMLHAAIITGLTFAPRGSADEVDMSRVMMISIAGGAPGPDQGRNPMTPKPVQEVAPDLTKAKNDAPPAIAKPEMVEPVKTAPTPPKAVAKPEPPKETPQLRGRTPTQGAEVTKGTARVDTGSQSQSQFGGLATSSTVGTGAYTDYADFCCPEYLEQMVSVVRRNWQERQGQAGENTAKFTIRRDGTVVDVQIERGANPLLDLATKRALITTAKLAPLPAAFTPQQLTVHLVFQYKR